MYSGLQPLYHCQPGKPPNYRPVCRLLYFNNIYSLTIHLITNTLIVQIFYCDSLVMTYFINWKQWFCMYCFGWIGMNRHSATYLKCTEVVSRWKIQMFVDVISEIAEVFWLLQVFFLRKKDFLKTIANIMEVFVKLTDGWQHCCIAPVKSVPAKLGGLRLTRS